MHLIHRGIINKKFLENNINSFKESFKKGFGVETDIHASKDGKFICFHDYTLKRIFKIKRSIKDLNYLKIKQLSSKKNNEIPLLKDLLKINKNRYYLFIEIKPNFSKKLLSKLVKETSKYSKCVFISFKHENIFKLLKLKKNIKVGLSFSPSTSIKTIIEKSKNNKIKYLILDKFFLNKQKINKLKIQKFYYTIKIKALFKKYSKNNLIFENL